MAALGLAVFLASRTGEPVYEGRPLQHYLNTLVSSYPPKSAHDPSIKAIHAMGPRAIPHLRHAFVKMDSNYVRSLVFLHKTMPNWVSQHLPDPRMDYLRKLRLAAAYCLATFGPLAGDARPELIDGLTDRFTANMSAYALRQIGPDPKDLNALVSLANHTNYHTALYAINSLALLGSSSPAAQRALCQAATNNWAFSRAEAIDALGNLGPAVKVRVPLLNMCLNDPEALVRIAALGAVWRLRGRSNAPVAELVTILDDEMNRRPAPPGQIGMPSFAITRATVLLTDIGAEAQPAVSLLRELLQSVTNEDPPMLTLQVAEALWRIAGETDRLVSVCQEALHHRDHNVRAYAAALLSDNCRTMKVSAPALDRMLASDDPFVRFYGARAKWKVEDKVEGTLQGVISGLQDHFTYYRNAEIRQVAAETLGEIGPPARDAVPHLLMSLDDGVLEVRIASTNALRRIDPQVLVKTQRR